MDNTISDYSEDSENQSREQFSKQKTSTNQEISHEIHEKKLWSMKNFLASVAAFLVLVIIFVIITLTLNLDLLFLIIIACFFIVVYSIALFFLLEPRVVKEINQTTLKTIQNPNPIVVEKPVQVVHEVEKRIYVTPEPSSQDSSNQELKQQQLRDYLSQINSKPKIIYKESKPRIIYKQAKKVKLNIPKYDYLGSTETKTYHKISCRMSKLIKKKYKVMNNKESFFKNRRYKPCEICILKTKKV